MLEVQDHDAGLTLGRPEAMAPMMPERASTWRRSVSAVWRIVLDDLIVATVDADDEPFAVTGGAQLWRSLDEPRSLDDLAEELGAGEARSGLEELLVALADRGVVDRTDS